MIAVLVAFHYVMALNIYPTTWGMRGAADIIIAPNAIFAGFTISCSRDARKKYLSDRNPAALLLSRKQQETAKEQEAPTGTYSMSLGFHLLATNSRSRLHLRH